MHEINHQLSINVSPERVYQALITESDLNNWWTRDSKAKPEVGTVAEFGFGPKFDPFHMRIDELVPNEKVTWHCNGLNPEWIDTVIQFEIKESDNGAQLQMRHNQWKSNEGIFPMCSYEWAYFLMSLKSYLETGKGTPALDDK